MQQAVINKEAAAKKVCKELYQSGCRLKSIAMDYEHPLITVESPSVALMAMCHTALESKEFVGNHMRKVWIANMNGCRVVWRSQTLRKM